MGDVIKKSQPKTLQLAMENAHNALPIEKKQIQTGVIYDTSLETTINIMKTNTGLFSTEKSVDGDIFWNGFPVEQMGGKKLKINEKIHNKTPGIQEVLTETSNIPLKKLTDKDREIFINISQSIDFENYKAVRGESKSSRYKNSETIFKKRNLGGQGLEKIIFPSNIIDIYTRLEILLEMELSGHTDTLTEASNLFNELYRIGDIQNEQPCRNAPNKFSII